MGDHYVPAFDIHTGISFDEYASWDLVNNSRLTDFARSPAYCKMRMGQPPAEPTPAMLFGTLAHLAVLEPVRFQALPIAPDVNRRTKQGKLDWAAYLARTTLPMTVGQYHEAMAISIAVRAHPVAAQLLKAAHAVEASLVWTDPATGLGCKGRPDALLDGVVVDLKLSRAAHPDRFPRQVAEFGMYRQAAHYLNGMAALGSPAEVFSIIAVENTPPHEVAVYDLHPDAVELGRRELADLMLAYQVSSSSGVWPGYANQTLNLCLPEWKQRELPAEQITMGGEPI